MKYNLKNKTARYKKELEMYLEKISVDLESMLHDNLHDNSNVRNIKRKLGSKKEGKELIEDLSSHDRKIWYLTARDIIKIDDFVEKLKNNKIKIYEVTDEENG